MLHRYSAQSPSDTNPINTPAGLLSRVDLNAIM